MNVFEKIEAQRKGKEMTDVWMVGQQLMDILRSDPSLEELVDKDLDNPNMGLADCAGKIKSWADAQQKKLKHKCICVPPDVAEGIIRDFYGLPGAAAAPAPPATPTTPVTDKAEDFDFGDFL